jgi:hypothetical protein
MGAPPGLENGLWVEDTLGQGGGHGGGWNGGALKQGEIFFKAPPKCPNVQTRGDSQSPGRTLAT